jgi:hypothetical protein
MREDLPNLHTLPIESFHAAGGYHQENFTAPMFIVSTSECNLIENDPEASPFLSIVIVVMCSYRTLCFLKIDCCFQIATESCTWSHIAMAIAAALFIGVRHANIRWKPEEDVYAFGIQSFCSFHFKSWSKIRNSHFPPICPAQNSNIIHQLR